MTFDEYYQILLQYGNPDSIKPLQQLLESADENMKKALIRDFERFVNCEQEEEDENQQQ